MQIPLRTLRAFRNGIEFGSKVRFPHALVMVALFKAGAPREKVDAIWRLTIEHAANLGCFAALYKAIKETSEWAGLPRAYSPALAGAIGGRLIWARYSAVNYQIVLYLFSRVIVGMATRLAR
ncbi:unnamed protein product, partial [Phaeothamnion confervicola]